jgi:hypothetical protein
MRLAACLLAALGGALAAGDSGTVKEIRNKNQWDTLIKYHKMVRALSY